MKTSLYKGLNEDQTKGLEISFKEGRVFRHTLLRWMKEREEQVLSEMVSNNAYNKSDWSFYQAENLAYIRAMRNLASMIKD